MRWAAPAHRSSRRRDFAQSRPISAHLGSGRCLASAVLRPLSRASRLSFRQVLSGAPAGSSGGALHAIVQPSPGKGGAAGAGDGGPLLKAALIDSRPLLAAALFVEFDADGSGEVSRDEFVAHVWMLLRASEEQRQRFAFAKLDVNRSGALERSDLVASMWRQLSIARTLSPLLVQLQLRRHALTETSPRPLRDLSETSPRPLRDL